MSTQSSNHRIKETSHNSGRDDSAESNIHKNTVDNFSNIAPNSQNYSGSAQAKEILSPFAEGLEKANRELAQHVSPAQKRQLEEKERLLGAEDEGLSFRKAALLVNWNNQVNQLGQMAEMQNAQEQNQQQENANNQNQYNQAQQHQAQQEQDRNAQYAQNQQQARALQQRRKVAELEQRKKQRQIQLSKKKKKGIINGSSVAKFIFGGLATSIFFT